MIPLEGHFRVGFRVWELLTSFGNETYTVIAVRNGFSRLAQGIQGLVGVGEYELRMGNPASLKPPMLRFVREVHEICDSILVFIFD